MILLIQALAAVQILIQTVTVNPILFPITESALRVRQQTVMELPKIQLTAIATQDSPFTLLMVSQFAVNVIQRKIYY